MLFTIYLNQTPLLRVTSLKIISFRVCDSTVLSFTDKEFSTFLPSTAPVQKAVQGFVKQQNCTEETITMKVPPSLMHYRLLKTKLKVLLSISRLYTGYGKRTSSFIFSWEVFQVLVPMLSFFFFFLTPLLLKNTKKLSTSRDNTESVCDFRVGRKFTE